MLKKTIALAKACSRSNPLARLERFAALTMRGVGTVGTGLERYLPYFYSVKSFLFQPFQPFQLFYMTNKYVEKRPFYYIFLSPGKTDGTLERLERAANVKGKSNMGIRKLETTL